jgi:enterobacterial common antigen flippase
VLRWICLGATLQVITWPMGFIIVAKGRPGVFFAAEFAWTIVAVALAWLCVARFGLTGAGVAFFGSYVFHWILINPIARWLSGFRWAPSARDAGLFFLALIGLVFGSFYVLPTLWAGAIGISATLASSAYSARVLATLASWDQRPRLIRFLGAPFQVSRNGSAH